MIKALKIILLLIWPVMSFAQKRISIGEIGHFQKAASFSFNDAKSIFVLDKATNEIIKIDSTGEVLKKIGGTGWDDYTFDNPSDLCVTMLKVYVSDKNNNRVQVFDKNLNFLFSLDNKNITDTRANFNFPVSAQASGFGDLFVIDSDNKQVIKFNSSWAFSASFGNYQYGKYTLSEPAKLVLDNESNAFLLDGKRIIVFDQYGNGILEFNLPDKPNNINLLNNVLILSFDNYILYSNISKYLPDSFRFNKAAFNTEQKIADAVITGGKIYLLMENCINIYNLK